MTDRLKPEQLSEQVPGQPLFSRDRDQEWVVESISRNENTRLAHLRKKNDPAWGMYTVNELMAKDFALQPPSLEEIAELQAARKEAAKWHGEYRKLWAPCDHGDGPEFQEAKELIAGKSVDAIIMKLWQAYMNIDVRLLTDMWCGLFVEVRDKKLYIEGDTPLLCFAMADRIFTEHPPEGQTEDPFWNERPPQAV